MPTKSPKHLKVKGKDTKKKSKPKSSKQPRVGKKKDKSNKSNNSEYITLNKEETDHYLKYKNFTKRNDKYYSKYKNDEEFQSIVSVNPSIYVLNKIFLEVLNKSFIHLLLKEENANFLAILTYYLHLKTLVKESKGEYPILELLISHGFNTIYDILLENKESFYLIGFLSHVASFEVIDNPNDFLISLSKNDIYNGLRNTKIILALQEEKLYTRIKKFQI